jgi:hypothetical protein
VNSISYFKVIAKEKKWKSKPCVMINIGPDGNLVLPAIRAMNMQPASQFWILTLKPPSLELTGRKPRTVKNVISIVSWNLL